MVILREYKSVAFLLIFVSLWIVGYYPCCNKEDSFSKIENQDYFNWVTSYIKKSMEKQNKWTLFKVTITPTDKKTKISLDSIKDIVSEEYIHNANNGNNNGSVNNIELEQNNIDENGNIMFRKFNKYNLNAFIVGCSDVNFTVGEMGEKANNSNIINEVNNKGGGNKTYYYVFIKDITTKKNEQNHYAPLFRALEETAENKDFSYSIEIINANTTGITDMSRIFRKCENLTEIEGLEKWDTSNVENVSYIFSRCKALKKIVGLGRWNTSKVTNMSGMFNECNALTELPDISNWDTKNVTNMSN